MSLITKIGRLMRWLQWKLGRGLFAFDALVLDYDCPKFTSLREKLWPNEYSRECPSWAIE